MKKHFAVICIILSLGVFSWAQSAKDLFDVKKSQTELEIMKGILATTISYLSQNDQRNISRFHAPEVSAYYLVGQGAVFVIPTSDFQHLALRDIANQDWDTSFWGGTPSEGIGAGIGKGIGSGTGAPPVPPAPPAPAASPAPAAPPAPPLINREELRKKVEGVQARIKKSREEAQANREKFIESLKEIRVHLVEALANYGDSLSVVKPNEYINLVLYTDDLDTDFGRTETRHDVISAQKSWITDYKAGRLNLENFKQKVLQYTE